MFRVSGRLLHDFSSLQNSGSVPAKNLRSGGIASISSGSLKGIEDTSAPSGFTLASPLNATLSINADGSGNLGANTVAVTNGTALYFIDETGNMPRLVQVFEP